MKTSMFMDNQIMVILKQAESRTSMTALCHEYEKW